MRKERKHYAAEEKVAILRRHLLDKVGCGVYDDFFGVQLSSKLDGLCGLRPRLVTWLDFGERFIILKWDSTYVIH